MNYRILSRYCKKIHEENYLQRILLFQQFT